MPGPLVADRSVRLCELVGFCQVVGPALRVGLAVAVYRGDSGGLPVLVDQAAYGLLRGRAAKLVASDL